MQCSNLVNLTMFLSAATLYDDREPIDVKLSEVALAILSQRKQG